MDVMGAVLAEGPEASGEWIKSVVPLSLWGGLDPSSGRVVDRHHPLYGRVVTGAVLALPGGRGSSTASAVWLEAVRRNTAPAALILGRTDPILVLGAVVSSLLYADQRLIVRIAPSDFERMPDSGVAVVHPTGRIDVRTS